MKNIKEFDSFSVNEGIGDFFKNLFKSDSKARGRHPRTITKHLRNKDYTEDDIADKIIEEMKKLDTTQFKPVELEVILGIKVPLSHRGHPLGYLARLNYSFTLPSLEDALVVITRDSIYIVTLLSFEFRNIKQSLAATPSAGAVTDKHKLDCSRTKALSAFNWIHGKMEDHAKKMKEHAKQGELTKRSQRANDLRTKLNLSQPRSSQ